MTRDRIEKLIKALEFYASPDTYWGIGFLPDPPCGDFMDDFSQIDGAWKPGKRARKALRGRTSHEKSHV